MDQKMRTGGGYVAAMLLLFCAFIFLALGVSMLVSYPEKVWLVGILLTGCSIAIGASGLKNYKAARNEQKLTNSEMHGITNSNAEVENRVEVLVSWSYTATEWKNFMKWERKKRSAGVLMELVVIIGLGTVSLQFLKAGNWYTALIVSTVVGVVYVAVKYFISMHSININENKMPEVIITHQAVIVNGHVNRFYGNNLWLGKVLVHDTGNFNVLEINYCWYTRSGQRVDEIRVPIPKGCLKEAIFLQELLMDEKKIIERPH